MSGVWLCRVLERTSTDLNSEIKIIVGLARGSDDDAVRPVVVLLLPRCDSVSCLIKTPPGNRAVTAILHPTPGSAWCFGKQPIREVPRRAERRGMFAGVG
jgi:hypothetical protein